MTPRRWVIAMMRELTPEVELEWRADLEQVFFARIQLGNEAVWFHKTSRTIRLLVKDRQAARASAHKILEWPFERVVVAHDTIVEQDAHEAVEKAFAYFDK